MGNFIERITEGTVFSNRRKEVAPLMKKWSQFGLLEGLKSDVEKENMSILLENQAKQILKESTASANSLGNAYGAADIQGYAAVAFPLVRRVFGSLVANDLVSVQPMSLPNGVVFFLDFIRSGSIGLSGSDVYTAGESIYGGGRKGAEITKGILLDGANTEKGLYNIAHGYHKARRHAVFTSDNVSVISRIVNPSTSSLTDADANLLRFDPDVLTSTDAHYVVRIDLLDTDVAFNSFVTEQNVFASSIGFITASYNNNTSYTAASSKGAEATEPTVGTGGLKVVRRLSRVIRSGSDDKRYLELVLADTNVQVSSSAVAGSTLTHASGSSQYKIALSLPTVDNLDSAGAGSFQDPGTALGLLRNSSFMEEAGPERMPELRIIVNSLMINTESRKLRASWTPELSQDLNAYHNIDAEVELTNLLSEQISQELDQLLLNDLLKGATAGTFYWSRRPGKFVNRTTGADLITQTSANYSNYAAPPDFTGNVSMWYETLIETINDLSAQIQRKTLRGGATFIVCGPEVANILEFSEEKGSVGVVNTGSISKKFDVMVSTYFPRNVILVGRKGSGFLESGYVYSPYVPLQMTPTVFDPDNFTPRKAVMTRFGRKMVRPDMYGLVIVSDLLG